MMDDDDNGGGGMSFATGYVFGRMSAESSQRTARFKELVRQRFGRPERLPYDADDVEAAIETWRAAVRTRDTTIAHLRQRIANLEAREADALADVDTLRRQAVGLHQQIEGRNGSISFLMAEAAELRQAIEERDRRIAALEAANARLKGWRA